MQEHRYPSLRRQSPPPRPPRPSEYRLRRAVPAAAAAAAVLLGAGVFTLRAWNRGGGGFFLLPGNASPAASAGVSTPPPPVQSADFPHPAPEAPAETPAAFPPVSPAAGLEDLVERSFPGARRPPFPVPGDSGSPFPAILGDAPPAESTEAAGTDGSPPPEPTPASPPSGPPPGFEPASLFMNHVVLAVPEDEGEETGEPERLSFAVPVFYESRTLALDPDRRKELSRLAAEMKTLRAGMLALAERSRSLRERYEALVSRSTPAAALLPDSPTLPSRAAQAPAADSSPVTPVSFPSVR